ncbi:MAG: ATPase, T2SS/T4P/T4SS family [bacterium]
MAKRLGELLLEENLVTEEHIKQAIDEQKKTGEPIGRILVKLGFITEEALYYFLALQFGLEYLDLTEENIPEETIKTLSKEMAEEFNILPVSSSEGKRVFATTDPDVHLSTKIKDRLLLHGVSIKIVITSETSMRKALARYYGVAQNLEIDDSLKEMIKDEKGVQEENIDLEFDESSSATENDTPVIKMANAIISEAVKMKASDVHLNPFQQTLVLRYRIDGVLQTQKSPPKKYMAGLLSRFKVMARLDIMEKRKAQDGRIKIKVQNKVIDLRVSVLPAIYGENIVMRILDQDTLQLDLSKLGFEPKELELYKEAIQSPYGLVLHTGPTGSGKTTTLYSALSTVNDVSKNIMTLEDPVEYMLPGIVQVQMHSEIGLTFATALRSVLRQDPNIMMVGEIRDKETADIAIRAALTGHLLLSTLHTNDAPSTIMRLIDMGIDPIYVGSAVRIIIAQRLLRKICEKCKTLYVPTDDDLHILQLTDKNIEGIKFYHGKGCSVCKGSGYKGQTAIYEIMPMTTEISEMVFAKANINELKEQAIRDGMRTLRQVALEKWKSGITTHAEVIRITTMD